ncbi:MAG: hypothetical protein ACRD16_11570 [Thermoanaerobaculia bacterium]
MSDGRPPTVPEIRKAIAAQADGAGVRAYLVGGAVRDAIRRRRVRDLDVAIEGDAMAFARGWARAFRGRLTASSEFGTAAVELGTGTAAVRVDFAATRAETYSSPAALPRVRPAGIGEDLARRDFTINAMAIPLNGPAAGKVLDPFGGRRDLSRGLIRMLHAGSPGDDPTRAFRAIRFARRFRFRIEPGTRRWIARAIAAGAFERLSGDRRRREVLRVLSEGEIRGAVRAMAALGLARTIASGLGARPTTLRRLGRLESLARRGRPSGWAALLAWSLDIPVSGRREAARRLGLAGGAARDFETIGLRVREARAAEGSGKKKVSDLAAAVRGWPDDTVLAVASALEPAAAARLLRARALAARVRLKISGDDLTRSGIAPGPAIGRALDQTWRARIDRRIAAAQELPYALAEVRK